MESLHISDEPLDIKQSELTKPDHCLLLENKDILVIQFVTQGIQKFMHFEVWKIDGKQIIKRGKQDIFGINFLTDFIKYIENLVAVLVSRSGEREILLYDFFNQDKISYCKNLALKEYQVNAKSTLYEIIPIQQKDIIIVVEKIFLVNDIVEDENTSADYMIMHLRVMKKNQKIAEMSIRRDYSQEQEEIKILKGNEQCLILADQVTGEVMLWDFIKYPREPFYLQFDCSDYIFKYVYFDRFENNQLIKFIFKSKVDLMVKVLIYNFTLKSIIVQSLKPSQKELLYIGGISYSNMFYFQHSGILLTANKYSQENDSIYFNVYKKNNNSEIEFEPLSDFKHRCDNSPYFVENIDFNYILFQNTCHANSFQLKQKVFEFQIFDFRGTGIEAENDNENN